MLAELSSAKIGFIGAGRTANALAIGIAAAGLNVFAVGSRSFESALALATRIPDCWAVATSQDVAESCDLVFITTQDASIREVAETTRWRAGTAVVHCSGVETSAILTSAAKAGAQTGSLHPLQTFAGRDDAGKLAGSIFAVEAEDDLAAGLALLVEALGATPMRLRPEDKVLYHAAAVFASNYVVTLSKLASDLWLRFGVDRSFALQALAPLLRGAVDNIESRGLPDALTGPIARGDVETVAAHLTAVRDAAPDLNAVYRELALQTIPIALSQGGLSDEQAALLRELLASGPKALESPRGNAPPGGAGDSLLRISKGTRPR